MKVAILVPVLNRPHRPLPLVESLRSSDADAMLYFLVNDDDLQELAAVQKVASDYPSHVCMLTLPSAQRSWAKKINEGWRRTSEEWMLLGADDIAFHAGFVEQAQELMAEPKVGVIGTNDLGNRATREGWHSTHPFVSRRYAARGTVDSTCELAHEGYRHNFADTELIATAKQREAYAHCAAAIVEHLHPLWKKSPYDDTYRLGQSSFAEDQALFNKRRVLFGWESRG